MEILGYVIKFTDETLYLNRQEVKAICDHTNYEIIVNRTAPLSQVLREALDLILIYRYKVTS